MGKECYQQLQLIISTFSHLQQFLDNDFIKAQCESGLKCHTLICLNNKEYGDRTRRHLPTLERRLAKLAPISGYDRLKPRLRGATDWDEYQEFLAQIDITLWFEDKGVLKEIEPKLTHREGYTDVLLSVKQKVIYCEVASFQSILKAIESKGRCEDIKIQKKLQKSRKARPWLTKQDIEEGIEVDRIARNLLAKTKKQLPSDYPGILALDTTKSGIFSHDVKDIAERLFRYRPHVALVILWSWEGDGEPSWDMIPTSFFANSESEFRQVSEALLEYLGLKNDVIEI